MGVLEISHASKSFGELKVLRDISLSVSKGDVLAIIGPSGSGKSTLLRCATFLERLDGGSLKYGDVLAVKDGAYARRDVIMRAKSSFGLVFQSFNLFPHLSVLENICIAQRLVKGRSRSEAEAKAVGLLKRMGLENKEKSYPCELSGGQQQRVSIARALAMDPSVLFFDEPTSALDPELTGEILKVIKDLALSKMTMVIVTHEISFARNVADRVVFMADGLIVEEGSPSEVIDNPSNSRTRLFLNNLDKSGK